MPARSRPWWRAGWCCARGSQPVSALPAPSGSCGGQSSRIGCCDGLAGLPGLRPAGPLAIAAGHVVNRCDAPRIAFSRMLGETAAGSGGGLPDGAGKRAGGLVQRPDRARERGFDPVPRPGFSARRRRLRHDPQLQRCRLSPRRACGAALPLAQIPRSRPGGGALGDGGNQRRRARPQPASAGPGRGLLAGAAGQPRHPSGRRRQLGPLRSQCDRRVRAAAVARARQTFPRRHRGDHALVAPHARPIHCRRAPRCTSI